MLAELLEEVERLRVPQWHIFIRHEMLPPQHHLRSERAPYAVRRLESLIRNAILYLMRRRWPRARSVSRIHSVLGNGRVRFYTDTLQLATHHRWGLPEPLIVLPIPAAVQSRDYFTGRNELGAGGLTVVYSGDARQEKGFHFLPEIVRRCRHLALEGKIRFRIQAHHAHGDPIIIGAREELLALSRELPIDLIMNPLSDTEYLELVQSANVMLAIYDPRYYRCRSSHVFIESIANGKVCLVRRGTSMAQSLPSGCRWVCREPAGAGDVLKELVGDWSQQALLAERLGAGFRRFHTCEELVRMLVGSSRKSRVDGVQGEVQVDRSEMLR